MEARKWTREDIERELQQYRENRCIRDQFGIDIEALRDYIEHNRDEAIEGGAFKSPQEPDMPRSNTIADPTARLAGRVDEEVELAAFTIKWRVYDRRVRRVEAWLAALPNRQRMIVEMMYIRGMVWGEIVIAYNVNPSDGEPREMNTLRNWKNIAMNRLIQLAYSESVGNRSQIGHVQGKRDMV